MNENTPKSALVSPATKPEQPTKRAQEVHGPTHAELRARRPVGAQDHDDLDGSFVRECPKCGQLHQSIDPGEMNPDTGAYSTQTKRPCRVCRGEHKPKAKAATTESSATTPATQPETPDLKPQV